MNTAGPRLPNGARGLRLFGCVMAALLLHGALIAWASLGGAGASGPVRAPAEASSLTTRWLPVNVPPPVITTQAGPAVPQAERPAEGAATQRQDTDDASAAARDALLEALSLALLTQPEAAQDGPQPPPLHYPDAALPGAKARAWVALSLDGQTGRVKQVVVEPGALPAVFEAAVTRYFGNADLGDVRPPACLLVAFREEGGLARWRALDGEAAKACAPARKTARSGS